MLTVSSFDLKSLHRWFYPSLPLTLSCLYLYPHPTTRLTSITSQVALTPCIYLALHQWHGFNSWQIRSPPTWLQQQAYSYSNLTTVNVATCGIPSANRIKTVNVTLDKNLPMDNHVNLSVNLFSTISYIMACISIPPYLKTWLKW